MIKLLRQHAFSSHLLVISQLCGVVLCCYPVAWQNLGSKYWLLLCLFGAMSGITTLCYNKIGNFSIYPEVKSTAYLITIGPYKYVRHPMYSSLIIMMVGIAFYNQHWVNFLGVGLVLFAVMSKANMEEKLLLIKFPEYHSYQEHTYRFIPYVY